MNATVSILLTVPGFMRATIDRDVATGKVSTACQTYKSTGPLSSFGIKNVLPEPPDYCIVDG